MKFHLLVIFIHLQFILTQHTHDEDERNHDDDYTNSFAVEINGGHEIADMIATAHGFLNMGQVGSLTGHYHFIHVDSPSRSKRTLDHLHAALTAEDEVLHVEQQKVLKRRRRDYSTPSDPRWSKQWYLRRPGKDMNVKPVWELGVTGRGAVVTILDDGIEHTHPDLKDNYDPEASYDFNNHDSDPFPRYDPSNENKHGTRCAGEVSAAKNDVCSVGVAYGSSIGGVRMLDGDVTDIVESSSLSFNPQHVHVYSSSWGPDDDGRTVDGPGRLARKAFIEGVTKGRNGLGSLFVWASGNGGSAGDSCNCDGYAVSPFTLAISSVTEKDTFPWYAEHCSANLACTYSSGSGGDKQVISTDIHHKCTTRHTGTSASAPMAAGLLALVLEVNPNLTWRDIQYIIVYSSNPHVPKDSQWSSNGAGLRYSHEYGFGLMDASALVNRARHWTNVPERLNCSINITGGSQVSSSSPLLLKINVATDTNCPGLAYLEHVQAFLTISIDTGKRGQLQITLLSPHLTSSTLLPYRHRDTGKQGFNNWPFMTVFNWGEEPQGEWVLKITAEQSTKATLKTGTLVLHGVGTRPRVIRDIPSECSEECQSGCARSGPQYCDTCKHYRVLSTLECVPTCPAGTYPDQTTCRPCIDNCVSCTNGTACLSCSPGSLKLSSGACLVKCPASTYQVFENKSCYECHASCMSCTGPSPLNCTLCLSNQYHLDEGACVLATNCEPGKYFDTRSFQCRACHETCAECIGRETTDCNACYPGRVLTNGECVPDESTCVGGEYYSEETSSCATCSPGCSECTDAISCIKCATDHFLHRQRIGTSEEYKELCVVNCPRGYYGDAHLTCSACQPFCGTCNSSDYCLTCSQSDSAPLQGACPQPCGTGQYYDTSTGKCRTCHEGCASCISSTFCTSCTNELLLNITTGECLSTCPAHTVTNEETRRCEATACHASCATCSGLEPDQCLSCTPPRLLNLQECIDACPLGQVLSGDACVLCDPACYTCVGVTGSDCSLCEAGHFLDDHSCVTKCRHGSFISNGLCLSCPKGCVSCLNSTHCKKCDKRFVLYTPSNKCLTNCPNGFRLVDGTCESCIVKETCTPVNTNDPSVEDISDDSSYSTTPLLLFIVVLVALISILVVLLLAWKREHILRSFRTNKSRYKVLYTAPDVMDGNGTIALEGAGSDSETDVFTKY